MAYYKATDDRRAVKAHDEAIVEHDRAWREMHQIGQEFGHDSPEYIEARRTVVTLRESMTTARLAVDRKRRWMPA